MTHDNLIDSVPKSLPPTPQVDEMLEKSRKIIERAIMIYQPYAIVAMISGGKDSLCAFHVAKKMGIFITHICHGVTGTGIEDTTMFVRGMAAGENIIYEEARAGKDYEDYVLRKGFFGIGRYAHTFSYHILKSKPFRGVITKIRGTGIGTKKRKILLLNGARAEESAAREGNPITGKIIREDGGNIWVNIIHNWRKIDRDAFLEQEEIEVNPVTKILCRSGECMCGTMQSRAEREEASFYYPQWGKWINDLEVIVRKEFGYGWGEDLPPGWIRPNPVGSYTPMCIDCLDKKEDEGDKDV